MTTRLTTRGFSYRTESTGYSNAIMFVVFGVQQWGYHKSDSSVETINFNIAYNNLCFGITGEAFVADNTADISPIEITNNSFVINPNAGHKFYWLSYGVQQWGLSYNSKTVSFPISFTTVPTVYFATVYSSSAPTVPPGPDIYIPKDVTVSKFVVGTYGSVWNNCKISYVFIGQQQWGYHGSMNQETTALVNLPIAFTTEGYWCHMSTSSSNPNNRGIITAVPNGTSQIKLINGNAGIANCRWYIVGKQQWGECVGSNYGTSIKFPLSFKSTKFLQMATPYTTGGFWQAPMTVWLDAELTAIYAGAYGGSEYLKAAYIAIGIQQWRFLEATASKNTWTYPIAFSQFVIITTTRYYTYSDEKSDWEMAVAEYSLTSCKIIRANADTKGIFCYAIGCQQWGKGNTTTNRDNTVTLPVTYGQTYTCMVAQYIPTAAEKYTSQVLTTSTNSTLYLHWGRDYSSGNYVKWMTIGY